jgi:hypothetical protein
MTSAFPKEAAKKMISLLALLPIPAYNKSTDKKQVRFISYYSGYQ